METEGELQKSYTAALIMKQDLARLVSELSLAKGKCEELSLEKEGFSEVN